MRMMRKNISKAVKPTTTTQESITIALYYKKHLTPEICIKCNTLRGTEKDLENIKNTTVI